MRAGVRAQAVTAQGNVAPITNVVGRKASTLTTNWTASTKLGQRDWLRKLQNLTNKPILIQRHKNNVWHNWHDDIPSLPYHTRVLLPCEICFDPDVRDWQTMKAGMDRLQKDRR